MDFIILICSLVNKIIFPGKLNYQSLYNKYTRVYLI